MSRETIIPGGAHLICLHGNHILLIKRGKNIDTWPNHWALPGGKVEDGEFFRECAEREVQEETGVIVHDTDIEDDIFVEMKTVQGMKLYYFGVTHKWEGMPENKEPSKHTDLAWFPISDLPSPLVPHHQDAINCINSKKKYTELDVTP